MYKILNFDDFFNDEKQKSLDTTERKIALTLISPNQMIHAIPNNNIVKFHLDISLAIISDMYKIQKPTITDYQTYRYQLITEINRYIKNDEKNFIFVRYILLRNYKLAVIEYPCYITEYEYECIKQLAKIYTEYCIDTNVIIHQYDPIDCCSLNSSPKTFNGANGKSALKCSVEYFEESKSIINYNLQAPKEYILKEKQNNGFPLAN